MKTAEQRQWYGIRTNVTDVLSDFGLPYTQIGTDMRTSGELRRRAGFQSTSIAQQAGPIRYIVSAFPPSGPFLTFDIGGASAGTIIGEDAPNPPEGPKRRRPDVIAGQPAAPVITGVIFNPASAVSGSDQFIDMTIVYTYDGLSGPISVTAASNLDDGLGNTIAVSTVVGVVVTYFLEMTDPPGIYTTGLPPDGIQLTAGPFTSNIFTPSFTVT